MLLCQLLLIRRGNVNKFFLKSVINLLILSPNFLAEAESVPWNHIFVTSTSQMQIWFDGLVFGRAHKAVSTLFQYWCCELICCLFHPSCRLKKKSQSVDIASQGFSPTLVPTSSLNRAVSPVAMATTGLVVLQDNNTVNSQHRSPRCGELKRGYTIGKWHQCLVCVCRRSIRSPLEFSDFQLLPS